MKLHTSSKGFLGQDEGRDFTSSYKAAKAVVIPFGFEGTVSYGSGTKQGPKAIIEASYQVETMDEQTYENFYECGIATLKEPVIPKNPAKAVNLLEKITAQVVADGKFPVILGGEHSITQGSLKGVLHKHTDITLLQFDAHPDMREHYHGSPFSHASVINQSMANLNINKVVQIGIRNMSEYNNELGFRKKFSKKIKTFWGWQKYSTQDIVKAIPTKNVFITFDVDAFDPSIMPSTGTPEPGGLTWWPVVEILKEVYKSKNVVGADVVELAPVKNLHHPDFLIARLVYKMIGYKFYDTQIRSF